MKKKELVILGSILVLILAAWSFSKIANENRNSSGMVKVTYRSEVVLRFDPSEDAEYWFEGSYGKLMVQVRDGKWRVTEEECPNHICSSIGWVGFEDYFPIVCLPNEISVEID